MKSYTSILVQGPALRGQARVFDHLGPLLAVLALFLLLLAAPLSAQEAEPSAASPVASADEFFKAYRLGTGDQIRLIVFGEEDLSGEFTIDDAGNASLPLIGNVKASDLTVREVEAAVRAKLQEGYMKEPRISIQVLTYRPFYIYGEVEKAGEYPFVIGLDIRKAVATAGGYTYRANSKRVYITRAANGQREELRTDEPTIIFPGDVIEIPERFF